MSIVKLAKSFVKDNPSKVTVALAGTSIGGLILSGIKRYGKDSQGFKKFIAPLSAALAVGAAINHKIEKK